MIHISMGIVCLSFESGTALKGDDRSLLTLSFVTLPFSFHISSLVIPNVISLVYMRLTLSCSCK